MRQKYVVSRHEEQHQLKIKEYAVIDKRYNKVPSAALRKRDFKLLCEEVYDSDDIINSISRGTDDLVSSLRTHNIFPIEPYATEIAKSVTKLFNSTQKGSDELFFDDVDLLYDAEEELVD